MRIVYLMDEDGRAAIVLKVLLTTRRATPDSPPHPPL